MKLIETISGKIAIIKGDNYISKWVEQSGRLDHDQNCLPLLKEFIKEGDYVIDAGSFIGDHTIFYSMQVGETGKVFAFEPLKLAFQCLEYNMKDRKNVFIYNNFLSNQKDKIKGISINYQNPGASYISTGAQTISMTIDELNLPQCNFIKIDVEGGEIDVLRGGKETIEKYSPIMLIEVNEGALNRNNATGKDLMNYVKSLGYSIRNIYENEDIKGNQFDILCLYQDGKHFLKD